jgi:hypothetical protein
MKPRFPKNEIVVSPELYKLPMTKAGAIAAGTKHYFTRQLCSNGHLDRRNLSGTCLTCDRVKAAAKREKADATAIAERKKYMKDYKAANKKKIAKQMAEYREENKETILPQTRARVRKLRAKAEAVSNLTPRKRR